MTDELNKQKAFLKWQGSAVVLQSDAKQGIDRAQRLLSMRYLRGRGVLTGRGHRFLLDAARRTTKLCHGPAQPGRTGRKRIGYNAGHHHSVSLVWSRSRAR
jgi:hypothetical protein